MGFSPGPVLRFNPSVGILWGGTGPLWPGCSHLRWFQSLGRDSVGWDYISILQKGLGRAVSIPRSGFCGVGPHPAPRGRARVGSFNPSVGILWGGTGPCGMIGRSVIGVSIPRSGFCGVGLGNSCACVRGLAGFQSLGRDSVGWDPIAPSDIGESAK